MRIRLLFVSICSVFAGCQSAQMRVHPALDAVAPLMVEGANPRVWNAPIAFGSWQSDEVREGMTWGFGYRLAGIEARYAQQPYRLAMKSPGGLLQAECMTRAMVLARNDAQVDPTLGRLPALSCGFVGAAEGTLRLRTTATNAEAGDVRFGSDTWSVRSTMHFMGSPLPSGSPLGYEIVRGDTPVGAVETINAGRVWIDPALRNEEKDRVALVAAVLLLYTPAEA